MIPLPFAWPIGLLFWLAYCWAFAAELPLIRRARRSPAARGPQDAGSLGLIVWAQSGSIAAAFAVAFAARWAAMSVAREPVYFAGVALLVAGGLLRRHCFRMLGPAFTGAVQVEPGQQVVDRGAYHWIRHPSYVAGFLMFAGIGLALGNWGSLALSTLIPALAYGYRVTVEERALVSTLGPPYEEYMRRTRRFIPYVL